MKENQQVAERLREAAALLEAQGASPFRSRAYRRAADTLAQWPEPQLERLRGGAEPERFLRTVPGIGPELAREIHDALQRSALRSPPCWGVDQRTRTTQRPTQPRCSTSTASTATRRPRESSPPLRRSASTRRARRGFPCCTRDWVVIYFYDGDHRERQCTVVTETQGPLNGRRIVRGREAESMQGAA